MKNIISQLYTVAGTAEFKKDFTSRTKKGAMEEAVKTVNAIHGRFVYSEEYGPQELHLSNPQFLEVLEGKFIQCLSHTRYGAMERWWKAAVRGTIQVSAVSTAESPEAAVQVALGWFRTQTFNAGGLAIVSHDLTATEMPPEVLDLVQKVVRELMNAQEVSWTGRQRYEDMLRRVLETAGMELVEKK